MLCKDCRCWEQLFDGNRGQCRRRAPTAVPQLRMTTESEKGLDARTIGDSLQLCVWPVTGMNDWCGEFQAKP